MHFLSKCFQHHGNITHTSQMLINNVRSGLSPKWYNGINGFLPVFSLNCLSAIPEIKWMNQCSELRSVDWTFSNGIWTLERSRPCLPCMLNHSPLCSILLKQSSIDTSWRKRISFPFPTMLWFRPCGYPPTPTYKGKSVLFCSPHPLIPTCI